MYLGKPIRGDILRKALEQFEDFGKDATEALIEHFEEQDIQLDNERHHSLQVVENQFNNIFGKNVTPLLIMHLEQFLGERNALGITTAPVTNEIKLKILCICSEEKDCSRLRVMNTAFLSMKVADKYLSSMASEGLINYNNETKRCEIKPRVDNFEE